MDRSLWLIRKTFQCYQMLRSDLCDFSNSYIVAKGVIAVTNPDEA